MGFSYLFTLRLARLGTLVPKLPITEGFEAEYLEYNRILPLEVIGDRLRVAVAGQAAEEVLEDLELSYGVPVEVVPVSQDELLESIRRTFAASESVLDLVKDLDAALSVTPDGADDGLADARDLANQPPVIRFVNLLIREAHEARASDIHLESTREGLSARFRVDGVLTDVPSPPKGLQAAVISRVKLIVGSAGLDGTHPVRRVRGAAVARSRGTARRARRARDGARDARDVSRASRAPPRDPPRHGAHGQWQDHHALCGARPPAAHG